MTLSPSIGRIDEHGRLTIARDADIMEIASQTARHGPRMEADSQTAAWSSSLASASRSS